MMSFPETIQIIIGLATMLTAIASLYTVREMRKQRKDAHKPELSIVKQNFHARRDGKGIISSQWVESDPEKNFIYISEQTQYSIKVFNIDAAILSINDINSHNMIDKRVSVTNNSVQLYDKDKIIKTAPISNESGVEFIFTQNIQKNPTLVFIPEAIIFIQSIFIESKISDKRNNGPVNSSDILNSIMEIDYEDISGHKYKKKYRINTQVSKHNGDKAFEFFGVVTPAKVSK